MTRPVIRCFTAACIGLLFAAEVAAQSVALDFNALDALAPVEQHRQLSLMLLVSAGVDPAMHEAVARAAGVTPGSGNPREQVTDAGDFDPEAYTSPLARIVDQASLLAGAERLFRFTLANGPAIRQRLDALEADAGDGETPAALGDTAAMARITEDTILIRTAIADSMAAAGLDVVGLDGTGRSAERRYREQTVVLRNTLEFAQFQAELDVLTDRAIASVGGKLDAYQRMFDVETNTGVLDRRIRSAELIYLPEGQFDPKAGELTEEMLRNMVLMESEPNR